jgi:hypothetical protein
VGGGSRDGPTRPRTAAGASWSNRYPKGACPRWQSSGASQPSVAAERFLMITLPPCLWCKRPFRARRGGSPKRFCCAAHRIALWSAARRWAERAVVSGLLSVDDIRNDATEACTLLLGSGPVVALVRAHHPEAFEEEKSMSSETTDA